MTARRPARLTAPSLENYPFINVMFHMDFAGFEDANGSPHAPDPDAYKKLSDDYFDFPASVPNEYVAPIQAMTEITFEKLCALFRPVLFETPIWTKADLEDLAIKKTQHYLVDEENDCGPYTHEQMQAFVMFQANPSKNIQWGKVASFYNESPPDQQEAIFQYFQKLHNLDLKELFELTGPAITLPDNLSEDFITQTKDGDTYYFSDLKQKWLRDDRFHQQYRIDIVLTSINARYLIGGAPTLDQAIAKASLHVKDNQYPGKWRVDIHEFAEPVAHAEVVAGKNISTKLKWNLDQLGADKTYVKSVKKSAMRSLNTFPEEKEKILNNIQRLDALIGRPLPVSRKDFSEALYRVEKALGLQWHKVHDLENALGL
jgi:hypothetical protein